MKRLIFLSMLVSAALVPAATKWPYPGLMEDSPLKLTDIVARPKYTGLSISPDGKYFAGVALTEDGKGLLHILDRRTMKVVHSEVYSGPLGVGDVRWQDNDNLLIDATYKSELYEGRGGAGLFMLNLKTKTIRPVWTGDGTADYGGSEGGEIVGRIDNEHVWLTVAPSGSTYSEFPFVYLYKLNVFTGRATKVLKSPSRGASFVFNNKNEVTHAVGLLPDDFDSTVVHKRVNGEWVLEGTYANPKGKSVPLRWHKTDPNKILYEDDLDAPTRGWYWLDVKTGKKELIYRDPRVDFDTVIFNDEDQAVAARVSYDYPTWVVLQPEDPWTKRNQKLITAFPDFVARTMSSTNDDLEHVVVVSSDRSRGVFYLQNDYDGTIRPLLDPRPWVKPQDMPQTHAVKFKTRDGMELVGYLTVPVHKNMRNLPLIILPHGGPHGPRDHWDYDTERIAFANAGYAVFAINYRGSGGYGREFQYNWYRHWGLEMQDDLEDGALWAAKSGIADINRVCIYGASYGGYASLMGVVKTPDRYKCAIGYVGVYDLNIMHEFGDVSRSRAGRKYLDEALGTDPADRAARSSTPHVDRIKVPVFLVHGMQDDRAHFQHYVEMREALLKKHHRFETLLVPRAGHGAQELESNREVICRMIDFFDRHIGDRKPTDKPADCQFPGSKKLPYEYFEAGK